MRRHENSCVVSVFDKKSREEFLSSPRFYLGADKNYRLTAGMKILFHDREAKEVFGIAEVGVFPDGTGKCVRPSLPLDDQIYSKEYHKYNAYQVCIKSSTFRQFQISFDDLATLLGINNNAVCCQDNNITLPTRLNYVRLFYEAVNSESVMKRLSLWLKTI